MRQEWRESGKQGGDEGLLQESKWEARRLWTEAMGMERGRQSWGQVRKQNGIVLSPMGKLEVLLKKRIGGGPFGLGNWVDGHGITEIGNSREAHSGGHGDRVLGMLGLGLLSDTQMNIHAAPFGSRAQQGWLRWQEAHRNGWGYDLANLFPERAKLVGEGWGPRMEPRGTEVSEDGWRRSPRTILRRRRPTGWKRTRGEGFWGRPRDGTVAGSA